VTAGEGSAAADMAAVGALTAGCLVLVGRRGGAGRLAGAAIVAAYLVYVAAHLAAG
jgi:hypothetical protein